MDDVSQMPDCILHHILSFIPTKDVVKTSILSRRWIDLWTSVRNLDFDDALLYTSEMDDRDFIDFVDRVLLLRDASDILKFRLSCRVCFNAARIHSWISYAVRHNVRNLDLCLFSEDPTVPSVLPNSIFSSMSLTSLKIELNCVLEIPNGVYFRCLKTLHLSLITFPDDDSTQRLFLGCRVLEDLVMLDCDWSNLKNVTISSWTLSRLTIDDMPYFPPDKPSGCKIMINAPNLTEIKYTGYLSNEIFLCDVSALVKAYISVPIPDEQQEEAARHVINMIKGLRGVAFFSVSNRTIEALVSAGNMPVSLPVFQNLTHLELSMQIGNRALEALMKLLNYSPNIEFLYFEEGFKHDLSFVENDFVWPSLPECTSPCLKTLTFKNFHGYDSEICFLKCVLKHACVSEKMHISCCKDLLDEPNRQQTIRNELLTIANGSASCRVTFSP